jgi:diguanylate cyclase (GGDEF)-like protein
MVSRQSRVPAVLQTAYLLSVGLGGLVVMALLLPSLVDQADLGLVVFLAMGILSEWAHVPLARGAVSLSFAAVLPAFALYGTGGAVLTMALGYLLGHAVFDTRGWQIKLFNFGQYVLTCAAAGLVYHLVSASPALGLSPGGVASLVVFTSFYFVINHFLVGLWFTMNHPEESLKVIWGEPAKWEAMTYLITAPLGAAVIMLYSTRGLLGAVTLFTVFLAAAFIFRLAFRLDSLNHELRVLYESAQELTQGLDLDTVKGKVFDILGRLAPYDVLALLLWDDVSQVLRCVDSLPEKNLFAGRCFKLGEGIVGGIAEKRKVEIVQPPAAASARPEEADAPYPPTLLVAPMVPENELVGVLVLGSFHRGRYTDDHARLLTIFAAQAGAALSRAVRYQETRQMAITDSKTGVYNYRFFYERLTDEIRLHEAREKPFSLIFIDVDHLKDINDSFGHQVGDSVLKQVAAIIQGSIRDTDDVARYGGEEFVVLLPGTAGEEALAVAERIRASVEDHGFAPEVTLGPAKVTITAGVATYPEHATKPDDLIFRADEAMYLGKNRGRNRVSLHTGIDPLAQVGPA